MADGKMTVVCLDSIHEIRAVHRMLFDRKFDGPEDVYFGRLVGRSVHGQEEGLRS
jgi:hypothetical protein